MGDKHLRMLLVLGAAALALHTGHKLAPQTQAPSRSPQMSPVHPPDLAGGHVTVQRAGDAGPTVQLARRLCYWRMDEQASEPFRCKRRE
ncbi:MAG: hypothetical protein J0G94_05350 [Sphingomonadales bacterium]|nr:hypothetical protein [Sphingomonadales bacterium]